MEDFIAVFEEGPWPGSYDFPKVPEGGTVVNWTNPNQWPLPKYIKAEGEKTGYYVKYWESAGSAKEGQARGAKYKWVERSAGKDLSK